MSNRINEDISYMKYLMGYEKGRVISEQRTIATKNIISEAETKDYSLITSELNSLYGSEMAKYGFNGISIAKTQTPKGELTVITFSATTSIKTEGGSNISTISYGCNTDGLNYYATAKFAFQAQYEKKKVAELTTTPSDAQRGGFRYEFGNFFTKLGNEACNLVTEMDTTGSISKGLESLYKTLDKDVNDGKIDPTTGKITYIQKGVGTNKYTEPIINITKKDDAGNITWNVEGFGYFPTSKTKSTVAEFFLKAIKDKIFSDPVLSDPQYAKNVTVTLADIRGGASNSDGAPAEVTFEKENYRTPVTLKPSITSANKVAYNSNKNLAKNRAINFWAYLKENFPTEAQGKAVRVTNSATVKTDGFIVNTGGVSDTNDKRDWNTLPIPGQQVYFNLTIELRPEKDTDKDLSGNCLWNSKVKFSYKVGSGHECDLAIFEIFANGIKIGDLDLGNGKLITSKQITNKTSGVEGVTATKTEAAKYGGAVDGTLAITSEDLANRIIEASVGGEVVITAKGVSKDVYEKELKLKTACLEYEGGCSTHSEIPYIEVFNNKGTKIYDAQPKTADTIKRCGGIAPYADACPLWVLGTFNPCAENTQEGTLSKAMKKTEVKK